MIAKQGFFFKNVMPAIAMGLVAIMIILIMLIIQASREKYTKLIPLFFENSKNSSEKSFRILSSNDAIEQLENIEGGKWLVRKLIKEYITKRFSYFNDMQLTPYFYENYLYVALRTSNNNDERTKFMKDYEEMGQKMAKGEGYNDSLELYIPDFEPNTKNPNINKMDRSDSRWEIKHVEFRRKVLGDMAEEKPAVKKILLTFNFMKDENGNEIRKPMSNDPNYIIKDVVVRDKI